VRSPGGWIGVWQYSDYREYRVVLAGLLRVEHADGTMDVQAGQGLDVEPGEGVRYTTPDEGGADYVTVCLPAFSRARASGEVIADVYALYSAQASRRLRRSAHSAWDASSVPTTPVTFATFARRITVEMQC